jgi:hypothetical protein
MHTVAYTFEALANIVQGGTGMIAYSTFLVECCTYFPEQDAEVTQARQATTEEWYPLALHLAVAAQALEHLQALRHLEELPAFEVKASDLGRFEIRANITHRRQRRGCPRGQRYHHF